MTRVRVLHGALLGALLSFAATGCDNYTYITVHAGLDNGTVRETYDRIAGCSLFVRSGDGTLVEKNLNLVVFDGSTREWVQACQETRVKPGEFGIFNYSSARETGTLEFVVNMYSQAQKMNNNPVPFVQGASRQVSVAPGGEVGKNLEDRVEAFGKSCLTAPCRIPDDPDNPICKPNCPITISL